MKQKLNIQSLVRPSVLGLKPYSSARDEYTQTNTDVIFLDANENPYTSTINRYPDPNQTLLKAKIAAIKGVSAQQMLLGNGSDEVLDLLVRAFCEPTIDNVITLPPTYGMYSVIAAINNIENKEVLLTLSFEPNVDLILETINAHTKIIFLCSPNNPTGNSFSNSDVERLLKSFNGIVVIDEAYIDFSEKESWLKRIDDFENLVITQTLSKAYGMAGIRLGICYASDEIIKVLNTIKPPYNVNVLSQEKALNILQDSNKIKNEIHSIIANKNTLLKVLLDVKFIDIIYPSDTNFILIKVDDANLRYQQLLEKGIVVRNRTNQQLCENTLRISVGTTKENNQLITVLKSL